MTTCEPEESRMVRREEPGCGFEIALTVLLMLTLAGFIVLATGSCVGLSGGEQARFGFEEGGHCEGPMNSATRYGLDWSKIPTDAQEEDALKEAKRGGHPAHYFPIFNVLAQTGLRVCEGMHLKWEHLLPGNMLEVTRRKKKVLRPEVIDLLPEFGEFLYEYGRGKTGWMFPGGSAPCIIHRRPAFVETYCPDCGRQIVRLDQIRKKCDRIANFATHMQQEHARTPDEIAEWVWYVSKEIHEPACEGGHLHIRSVQSRFRLVLTQVGAYVRGRGVHSMRHAFAIKMWKETRDLMTVKQLLGHEQVTTTQVYATAVGIRDQLQKIGRVVAA